MAFQHCTRRGSGSTCRLILRWLLDWGCRRRVPPNPALNCPGRAIGWRAPKVPTTSRHVSLAIATFAAIRENSSMLMARDRAAELGRETVQILGAGRYSTATAMVVEIRAALRRSVEGTCTYPPDRPLADIRR